MLGQGPGNRRLGGQTGPRLVPTPDTAPSCPGTPRAPPLGPRSSSVPPPPQPSSTRVSASGPGAVTRQGHCSCPLRPSKVLGLQGPGRQNFG